MKISLWVKVCLLIIPLFFSPFCKKQTNKKPNVLIISIDTLRADYLGCYGHSEVKTPVMDALAAEGIKFMKHVAPSQCTNPSHVSIFTGLYPSVHQVLNNETLLADEAITMAEVLQKHGYFTLGAVSVGHLNPKNCNLGQGFDKFLPCNTTELIAGERNQLVFKELKKRPPKPFFCWIHYFDPHGVYSPPAPFNTMYPVKNQFNEVAPRKSMNLTDEQKSKAVDPDVIVPLYKGEISYLDSQLGELFKWLKKEKLYNNTIIILVADHGESMVEKEIYFCHAGMYNPVIHIPMIIRLPRSRHRRARVTAVTGSSDIFPTILEFLKIPAPQTPVDGVSLLTTFTQPDKSLHPFVISEAVNGVIRTIYQGEYKYIKPFPKDWACKEPHLFKAWSDYQEQHELIQKEPGKARHLDFQMMKWLKSSQKRSLSSRKNIHMNKKDKEALKTLGYID